MSAIRSQNNAAEVQLRKELHALGCRFRIHVRNLFGSPDIVFSRKRIAVFVDGDFWHARVLRERGPGALRRSLKTRNRDYWVRKFSQRLERDDSVTSKLTAEGWTVLRYWESEVKADPLGTARQISKAIRTKYQIKPRFIKRKLIA